jgi:Nuclease-related domain
MSWPTPSDRDRWPSHDHHDEQPGVSIRPLTEADLAAILGHLDHQQPYELRPARPAEPIRPGRPVLAVRVRASVGRPGASARAEYRRRRARELATWRRGLPWRLAAVLTAGAAAGLVIGQANPRLGLLAALAATAVVGWLLRFRPSRDTQAWRRGASGEQRTAHLLGRLERHGWAVLHDLAIPGSPANLDHLAIGPGGVLLIDSKHYRGRLWLDDAGFLWHGRHPLVSTLRRARWAADQADDVLGVADVDVRPIVAVHGASIPWGQLVAERVTVLPARRLPRLLQSLPPVLAPEQVAWLADRARLRFRPAA